MKVLKRETMDCSIILAEKISKVVFGAVIFPAIKQEWD